MFLFYCVILLLILLMGIAGCIYGMMYVAVSVAAYILFGMILIELLCLAYFFVRKVFERYYVVFLILMLIVLGGMVFSGYCQMRRW